MRQVRSCGVLVFRESPQREFLLMRHAHRFDLPKGHREAGESEKQCALRELEEETGLVPEAIRLDPGFRYEQVYYPRYYRRGLAGEIVEKTLVVFLAWLLEPDRPIRPTEHAGFEWMPYAPPHAIQGQTVDPLLAHVVDYWADA